jgi:tryptophan synthase alpha chain
VKVANVLTMVRDFRLGDDATPVVLMGYLNPILSYGPERFCVDAAAAGVDGLIVVDLPTEEADLLLPFSNAHGLDFIRLVAPTTDDARLPYVLNGSSGFVYYVAITGITGTTSATTEHLEAAIPRLRLVTDLPIAIGFGVRTPEQAGAAARIADGAVVASALIDTLSANLDADGKALPGAVAKVLDQVRGLAEAVRR